MPSDSKQPEQAQVKTNLDFNLQGSLVAVLDTWDHLRNRINFSGTFSGSKNVPKTLFLILRTFQNTDIYLGLQGSLVAVPDTWDHLRNRINFLGSFSDVDSYSQSIPTSGKSLASIPDWS